MNWLELFKKGRMVANPAFWKNSSAWASGPLGLALLALGVFRLFGGEVPFLAEDVIAAMGSPELQISGGLLGTYHWISTMVSSKKVGIGGQAD